MFDVQSPASSRRNFLQSSIPASAALASLLGQDAEAAQAPRFPNFGGKAKRIIYLMQGGAPSHVDLLDWKPGIYEMHGQQLPDSVRMGQRLTTMTANQKQLPMLARHSKIREIW